MRLRWGRPTQQLPDRSLHRFSPAWYRVNGLALWRLGETVVVVNLAKLLVSDEAAWIPGHTFRVDVGDTLLPC